MDTIQVSADEIDADFNVYTDGSVSGGLLDGGEGVMDFRKDPTSLKVVKTIRLRSARFTLSYEGEIGFWTKRCAGYKCRKILQ